MKLRRIILLTVIAASAAAIYLTADPAPDAGRPEITGNLLTVVSDGSTAPSRLIHYEGMDVSFNPEARVPNWVAWELNSGRLNGEERRSDKFMADPNVKDCPQPADYHFSGYDRGHMAPAGDMKWSRTAMNQSFYLTNIAPQSHQLNNGAWKKLEEKCRQWAVRDSALFIVSGPVLTDEITEFIGGNRVAVPRRFFKVVIAPYANPPRGIGFIMPNGPVEGGMQKAVRTIDEVEAITGYDFFPALPDTIENAIEARANFNEWR